MSESVEQAALRRARFEDRTLAILERCVTAVEALDQLDDQRVQEIEALSNRIESLTRTVTAHHGQLAQLLGRSPLDERGYPLLVPKDPA